MKTFEQLAQAAYAAYCKEADKNRDERQSWPQRTAWVDLSPHGRACWVAAAKQMVAEISALH